MTPTSYFIYLSSLIASRHVTKAGKYFCSIEIEIFSVTPSLYESVWAPLCWSAVMTPAMRIKSELILKCSNKPLGLSVLNARQSFMSIEYLFLIYTPRCLMFPLDVSNCCQFPPPRVSSSHRRPGKCVFVKNPGLKAELRLQWTCWNVSLKK